MDKYNTLPLFCNNCLLCLCCDCVLFYCLHLIISDVPTARDVARKKFGVPLIFMFLCILGFLTGRIHLGAIAPRTPPKYSHAHSAFAGHSIKYIFI